MNLDSMDYPELKEIVVRRVILEADALIADLVSREIREKEVLMEFPVSYFLIL